MLVMLAYPLLPFVVLLWLSSSAFAAESILYSTDFSEFELGNDTIVGNNGWMSTHPGQGVHGALDNVYEDGNRSASIGFEIPTGDADVVTMWRPIDIDPVANDSLIHFSTDLAIIDSEVDFFDSFYFSVFNQEEDVLASIVFDNTIESFGIWQYDGLDFIDLSINFEHDTVYQLAFTIDFANNAWSAYLDDLALFEESVFTVSEEVRNLGDIAAEWEITDLDNVGDNWMHFDNWSVSEETFEDGGGVTPDPGQGISFTPEIAIGANGQPRLTWPANDGDRFVVEHSDDLVTWNSDLPNAQVTATADNGGVFRDSSGVAARYYRVR
ncbi:MAG: hypothetical protein ACI957_003357, partial [Verrucomicrobiales bacterium]